MAVPTKSGMHCDFDNPERKCPRCGFRVSKRDGLPTWKRNCTNPGVGPGTELKRLLARVGIEAKARLPMQPARRRNGPPRT